MQNAYRGLIVAFGLSSIGFAAMAPFLVVWGHRDAGLTGAAAGLLFVAQAAGEITGGLAGGVLADRLGGRQVLLASTAGMTLGYGSLAFAAGPAAAIILIFVAGLFEAAYHPTAFALIGELTPADDRVRAFGTIRTAGNLGTILGPLAGAAVAAGGGARLSDVFLVSGGMLAASGVVVFATQPRHGARVDLAEEAEEIQEAVPGLAAIARDRRLLLLVIGGGLLAISLTWWESDGLALVQSQRAFSSADFSLMLALSAAVTVLFQIPVTRLARGKASGTMLGVGALVQTLGLAALTLASLNEAILITAVVLIAFGQMIYSPQINTLVSRIAPRGRGATYQAAISTTADIGTAAGPASGLALGAGIGAQPTWLLALPLGLLAATAATAAAHAARPRHAEPAPASAAPDVPAAPDVH